MRQKTHDPHEASVNLTIHNEKGVHTRPATEIIKCANQFQSHITICYEQETIDTSSILSILMLGIPYQAKIQVRAEGPDADAAIEALTALNARQFGLPY